MTYYENPPVADSHRQIIIGTVLGGSSLVKPAKGKNCYLFMRSRDPDWMLFKANQLKPFASSHAIVPEGNSFRWHSNCYPLFCEMRELLYEDKKKRVTMDILNSLRPIALMVWYGDAGKIVRKKAVLNTHKLGEESTNIICQFFNEVDMECKVTKERKYLRISFTPDSTISMLKRIAEMAPPCIHHKYQI